MCIKYSTQGSTLIVSIDRPERRNAVDFKTSKVLVEKFKEFENDSSLSVAILTGSGGQFCAGADLQSIAKGALNRMLIEGDFAPMGPTRLRLSKPVIAAIEGYSVAGGLELALWCDLRVAAQSSKFGVFCRRFGVPLIDLGTIRLPRLIGQSRAADMILTGREVAADEALSFGLVNRLCDDGEALNEALKLAEQLAKFPQACLRSDRRSMYEQWDLSESEAIKNEIRLGMATVASGEMIFGASAFSDGKGRHGSFET